MTHLRVRNFDKFQNYKDRTPPWIKLYNDLLDNYEFNALPESAQLHLMKLWLLASRMGNKIPYDPAWITRKIGAGAVLDLDTLFDGRWLEPAVDEPAKEQWPSRYVPAKLAAEVRERDGGKCVDCGSTENVEIDHITPVSRGGKSVLENLALRCRKCNRQKRSRDGAERAEQLATQTGISAEQLATQSVATRSVAAEPREEKRQSREEERRGDPPPIENSPRRGFKHDPSNRFQCVPVPATLLTANFDAAWMDWHQARAEAGKPVTTIQARELLSRLEGMGPTRAVAAIKHSIAGGYANIFEPDADASLPHSPQKHLTVKDVLNER